VLVADAEPVDRAGTEALDHHVGGGRQLEEGSLPRVGFEVEEGPLHVAVPAVRVEGRHDLHPLLLGHRADLDHLGPVVGQPPRGPRRRPDRGQVEHPDAVEEGHGASELIRTERAQRASEDDI
jgi:hypothetical protein